MYSVSHEARVLQQKGLCTWALIFSLALFVASTPGWSEGQEGIAPARALPQETLTRARVFEAHHKYNEAIADYRTYLAAYPADDEVRGSLARLLSWQGAYEEAITLYEDILTRHPADLDVRVALARVRSWQQRFAEAQHI